MCRNHTILIAVLLSGLLLAPECRAAAQSISELEQRLEAIDAELEQLASYSLRNGVGPVGYRSLPQTDPNQTEWIQIELGENTTFDQIVLVPTIWRDTQTGLRADGFPQAFKIIAGNSGDTEGTVIAHYKKSDRLLPRIAPLLIHCPATTASWLRLETITLSPRIWDGQYVLQLSEIMVFRGEENIALHKPVTTSSPDIPLDAARDKRFLVDGFVPYLMDAATGQQSTSYVSSIGIGEHPSLSIDLGRVLPVNRIHLYASDLSDTIPQSLLDGFGVPPRLLVEGANQADFSDAVQLFEYRKTSIYDTGPIIMRRFTETACRYIRLTATEPFMQYKAHDRNSGSRMGFGEIEIYSQGRNVALGKSFETNYEDAAYMRTLYRLTDGHNFYGLILPIRSWMSELAQRHELEVERPIIVAALQQGYERQKINLRRMIWLAAVLVAGIAFTILINRMLRLHSVFTIRERIAANLHDELGANLQTIGMLGELAKDEVEATGTHAELAELVEIVDEIRAVGKKTSAAARTCTNMLETPGLNDDLIAEMTQTSNLFLADLEHDITFEGEDMLRQIRPRARIDIYLFYKECLTNILRHSGATRASIRITGTKREVRLTVTDNGSGLGESKENGIPASLKRRARLLGAKLSVESPSTGGTSITLIYRRRRIKFGK